MFGVFSPLHPGAVSTPHGSFNVKCPWRGQGAHLAGRCASLGAAPGIHARSAGAGSAGLFDLNLETQEERGDFMCPGGRGAPGPIYETLGGSTWGPR